MSVRDAAPRRQRTQQESEESFKHDYCQHAVEHGVQYYVAGRFAMFAQFIPVCASIMHHAVELLLKACLARQDTGDQIRGYRPRYGHSLDVSWQEFKRRNESLDLATYDEIIRHLDQFEHRYPEDQLIPKGADFRVGLYEMEKPTKTGDYAPEPQYVLMLPQIDRLMALLFEHAQYSQEVVLHNLLRNNHAATYYALQNATPLVERRSVNTKPPPTSAGP